MRRSVSLVLGSGGARGLAHVGVIDWLLEHKFEIRSIAGSSIGALVGGVYAAGRLEEYRVWATAIGRLDVFSLLDFSWDRSGLVRGERVIEALRGVVGEHRIEDLPLRYTAVAVDLRRMREVWIQSGPLFDAIRASASMPLLLTPHARGENDLVDGGVLDPVPIAPTFSDDTDLTIAVNLGGPVALAPGDSLSADDPEHGGLGSRVARLIERFRETEPPPARRDWSALEVAGQCLDAMQAAIARQKLAAYPPDFVVEIPRDACGVLEFHRAAEMIVLGHQRAGQQLASLLE
jgi:NTE family protein